MPSVVSLSYKLYPQCLVLVVFRNEFKRDLYEQNVLFYIRAKINKYKLTYNLNGINLTTQNVRYITYTTQCAQQRMTCGHTT